MKKACYVLDSRLSSIYAVLVVGRTRFELVTNGLKVLMDTVCDRSPSVTEAKFIQC